MKQITAEHVEAFAGVYLAHRYDQPQPTPEFHRECWARYCSSHPACATAAPRNHAKSTGLTHDFALACVCLRVEDYIIVVGASEEMAVEHLQDMVAELEENEELRTKWAIKGFVKKTSADIIVECVDGHQFRILARGSEQKIRGRKWRGKRPGLILCDDLEDDEQVENKDRRAKFRKWFFRACKQALRDGGRIRVHGTILHIDSLLAHLMKNKSWDSRRYKAHKSMSDFSEILWPEKFPEARLRLIKQEFVNEGDSAGYSQEYLNDPQDDEDKYLHAEWFVPMTDEDHQLWKKFACGIDFALSKKKAADTTQFVVGGKDLNNITHIVDIRGGRLNSAEIIDMFFEIHAAWHPRFFPENGKEWLAIEPILIKEMLARNTFLDIAEPLTPIDDKKTRGRPFQKRMKVRACRFDTMADWFPDYKEECLMFTGNSDAAHDDKFDASATLFMGLEIDPELEDGDEKSDEELEFEREAEFWKGGGEGRSSITGY